MCNDHCLVCSGLAMALTSALGFSLTKCQTFMKVVITELVFTCSHHFHTDLILRSQKCQTFETENCISEKVFL